MTVMMKCGHTANSEDSEGNPCCVICVGIHPGAKEINNNPPDLSKRKASCSDCGRIVPSKTDLAFFEYRPNKEHDSYYCGCYGWN